MIAFSNPERAEFENGRLLGSAHTLIVAKAGVPNTVRPSADHLRKRKDIEHPPLVRDVGKARGRADKTKGGCLIAAIPAAALFMSLQKWMVSGLTQGSVKG